MMPSVVWFVEVIEYGVGIADVIIVAMWDACELVMCTQKKKSNSKNNNNNNNTNNNNNKSVYKHDTVYTMRSTA